MFYILRKKQFGGEAPKLLFLRLYNRAKQAKMNNELFKLFAKVLLAFRPFAMCLKIDEDIFICLVMFLRLFKRFFCLRISVYALWGGVS
jgi:hypothetical protein